uniref:Homocysteine-responsive endoplasmic reticulum-resident ubiquitin-like domain member 2 protein n=1 Tax=Acrobeloides nanus TaxID=290746 RepID=A0A914E7M8_9BILA
MQLKKHLNEICASKPDISRMRLIYAGHCLDNAKTLREIFNKRHEGMEGTDLGPQVIHMVCAPIPQMVSAKESIESSIRRRQTTASSTNGSHSATASSSNLGQQQSVPLMGQNYPMNFAAMPPYGFYAAQNLNDSSQQNAYYNYVAAYQNYMQAMMGFYQQAGQPTFSPFMPFPQTGQAVQFPQNGFNVAAPQQNQFNFDQNAAPANQPVNIQPQPAAAVQNVDEQPNDLLDVIYKFIRFGLFLMILFLYSSLERFFVVCIVICVIWFLHMRRERGQHQQQQMAQEVNNNANANQRVMDEAVNDNNNNQVTPGEGAPQSVVQESPNAWTVFWSTVSSFFTSLIPENPVPMNVN